MFFVPCVISTVWNIAYRLEPADPTLKCLFLKSKQRTNCSFMGCLWMLFFKLYVLTASHIGHINHECERC